jgi:hypothetical protein
MASGYFPYTRGDYDSKRLTDAEALIQHVIDGWYENRGGLNPEDAAQDQSYIDGLFLAKEKIGECLRIDESDEAQVRVALAKAEKELEYAEQWRDRLSSAMSKIKSNQVADKFVEAIKGVEA